MWKWLLGIFVGSVIVCGAGGYFASKDARVQAWFKTSVMQQKATDVRLEAAATGDVTKVINAPGSIEPKTKVQISAQVIARIIDLPFREGDHVRSGDVVVKLDSRELAAALESTQAQLRVQEAQLRGNQYSLEQSERDVARMAELFKVDAETKSNMEQAQEKLDRARSAMQASSHAVEAAKQQIVRARKDLENTTIIAPFDGTITKLNAEVGELVVVGTLNNASSVVMEIADLSTMLMKARVDESNIAPVAPGQTCKVFINAYTGRNFPGKVEKVGLKRQVDRDGTGYFEVEILVDKPKDLIFASGLTANVDIEVRQYKGVIKVPSQAVVDRKIDDLPQELLSSPLIDRTKAIAQIVYIVEKGKAKAVAVKTGASDLTHTIIETGITAGQKIVVGPYKALANLKNNDEVKPESKNKEHREGKKPGEPEDDGPDDEGDLSIECLALDMQTRVCGTAPAKVTA